MLVSLFFSCFYYFICFSCIFLARLGWVGLLRQVLLGLALHPPLRPSSSLSIVCRSSYARLMLAFFCSRCWRGAATGPWAVGWGEPKPARLPVQRGAPRRQRSLAHSFIHWLACLFT
ncbi:uncharacterized protein K452DRAFT_10153 [Aplosporella prunicola CBS 121167]|uniref:Uncharacterized protein n=1 Tax=Aplosporella prunicola CBS 121167 TaxID=1176127 RepID=A0A6A6BF05_9PEZI|nr:uncharacterized protein K452DRAFT_10153 [Aplosporella prunicola CBS 121167]KAF2142740.1 hypothetical protein K452DRAFT_10153 [Aplosporella prunicola CBS 121167]